MNRDRINNTSSRQKLDPINKNIIRRENPVELFIEVISTFDAENTIVSSLIKNLILEKMILLVKL